MSRNTTGTKLCFKTNWYLLFIIVNCLVIFSILYMLATGTWFLHTYWFAQPQLSRAMWRAVENGTRDQRETDTSKTSRHLTFLQKEHSGLLWEKREVKLQVTHSFADMRYKCLEGSVWLHSLTGQHCAAVKWTSTGSTGFHVEEVVLVILQTFMLQSHSR